MAITIDDSETLFSVIDYHVMGRGFKDLQREALLTIIKHCAELYPALEAMPDSMKKQAKLYDAHQELTKQEEKWLNRLGDWRTQRRRLRSG